MKNTGGRPPKMGITLLRNGLPPDLHEWYKTQGAKYGLTGTELRRRVLLAFRDGTSWRDLNEILSIERNERVWKPKEAKNGVD